MVHEFNFPLQIERGDDPSKLAEVRCIDMLFESELSQVRICFNCLFPSPRKLIGALHLINKSTFYILLDCLALHDKAQD